MGTQKRRTFRRSRKTIHPGPVILAAALAVSVLALQAGAKTCIPSPKSSLSLTEAGPDPSLQGTHNITINYHGTTRKVISTGETTGELLSRLALTVTGEDLVSHGMDDRTHEGMVLTVGTPVTVRETYSGTLPHGVHYCNDATLPQGQEAVLVKGSDGELLYTADVTYVNGVEVSRQLVSQTISRPAVTQIVAQGTGQSGASQEDAPLIQDGYITLPTGEVLTYYKTDTIRATAYTHTDEGCDMVTATGTSVHWGTVAVDPRYIPYGTRMFIMASDGSYVYGVAVAEDCGGDIKGDRMDLYMPTFEQCMEFGRRRCTIYFLG